MMVGLSLLLLISITLASRLPDSYEPIIVVFNSDVTSGDVAAHHARVKAHHSEYVKILSIRGGAGSNSIPIGLRQTYDFGDFQGYSGDFHSDTINHMIRTASIVKYVEPDMEVKSQTVVTQKGFSWALSRISHKKISSPAYMEFDYVYDSASAGENVTVYVIDTGIFIGHDEFEGRAVWGATFSPDGIAQDLNGHGTITAGVIAGKTFGVAKKARLVAVKTQQGEYGLMGNTITGMQWATNDSRGKKAIISLASTASFSQAMNDAARSAVMSGLVVVVAAGNDNTDVANYSPASEPAVLTIAATAVDDTRASWSNYGSSVDLFAPGLDVVTAAIGKRNAWTVASGTSLSSPLVAGLAACVWSSLGPVNNTVVVDKIRRSSLVGVVKDAGQGSPNRLVYNLHGGSFASL